MRFAFFSTLFLLSLNLYADDCRSQKIYHPDNPTFLGCNIDVVTPSYHVNKTIDASLQFTVLDCLLFCENWTVVPVTHHGHNHLIQVPRSLVNRLLELRSTEPTEIPPERFIQMTLRHIFRAILDRANPMQELWEQHVESMTHQKDNAQILSAEQYHRILLEDLSEDDKNSSIEDRLKCPLCLDPINQSFQDQKEIVQIHCSGNHIFCKECIENSYHYQKICPICRSEIQSTAIQEPESPKEEADL